MAQKIVFWLYYYKEFYNNCTFADFVDVILNGLPLDAAIAGYLTAIPALLLIVAVWWQGKALSCIFKGYYVFCAILLALIYTGDLALYEYWGFRLDTTPLFYLKSSPKDAFASATLGMIIIGVLVMAVYVGVFLWLCKRFLLNKWNVPVVYKIRKTVLLTLLAGALFLPIRGGLTVSTLNTGKVYFSQDMRLNHAAINPCFSLLESLSKNSSFASQYRFMEPEKADMLFGQMVDTVGSPASADTLLRIERPNIVVVILESFLNKAMGTLGGLNGVAVNLDSLGANGVLFTNFYANSFRTDRGIVSILSGYPAQPTNSIMKYPRKSQTLPSISKTLARNGYDLQYVYGGDADFTNMRSYLTAMGFENIISDADFPLSSKLSKWGAHDDVMFDKIASQIEAGNEKEPFLKVIQTSSSHEPFHVPDYGKLEDIRLNSIAFADSCLQCFINRYRNTPYWDNTLFVFVADHAMQYPVDLDMFSSERYRIPLILYGEALRNKGLRIDTPGSQTDIAATLLAQMGLPYSNFKFSKNMLNPQSPHFGFFTVPDAFGVVTDTGEVVFDNVSGKIYSTTLPDTSVLERGKAYLQKLYDDLDERGNKKFAQ